MLVNFTGLLLQGSCSSSTSSSLPTRSLPLGQPGDGSEVELWLLWQVLVTLWGVNWSLRSTAESPALQAASHTHFFQRRVFPHLIVHIFRSPASVKIGINFCTVLRFVSSVTFSFPATIDLDSSIYIQRHRCLWNWAIIYCRWAIDSSSSADTVYYYFCLTTTIAGGHLTVVPLLLSTWLNNYPLHWTIVCIPSFFYVTLGTATSYPPFRVYRRVHSFTDNILLLH